MDSNTMLPPDLEISERSRKFYNGTYKWDSEGFTDESGEYRSFNEDDPVARAPTPLPPFLGHPEREDKDDSGTEEQLPLSTSRLSSTDPDALYAVENATPEVSQLVDPQAQNVPDGPETFGFSSQDGMITLHRDDLFRGRSDREQLLSKLEDIHISSRHKKTELTLEECYRLCGIVDDTTTAKTISQEDATRPGNVGNDTNTEPWRKGDKTGQASASKHNHGTAVNGPDSDLSDCRSDISDGGLEKTTKAKKAARNVAADADSHKEDDDVDSQPKRKATKEKAATRGVAQKVRKSTGRKGTKGTRAGGEDLLGRRRSTRLAKHGSK